MARPITPEEKDTAQQLLARARAAMQEIADYDQARIDRLCQAVGWATANEKTFTRLCRQGVEESGIGDWEGRPGKRFKIMGILRDCLRQKSMGIVEEIPEKGIVKYAKPAGVICGVVPMTSSLGCDVWGGNITNENISLKHYLQYTWVGRPIAEDRPSDQELFGEFFNTETL